MSSVFSGLQRSLLGTLAYFDDFDYPLTLMELRRFRYRSAHELQNEDAGLEEIQTALETLPVESIDGYYALRGRTSIVDIRRRRYRLAEGKFSRALRAAAFFRLLPSVSLVAVCNSLAFSNADEESDIDLFIVCKPGTVWTTRFFTAAPLAALGLRPSRRKRSDGLCVSFYLSEDALDISGVALPEGDTYLRYWIASLVPLYDAGGVMERFFAANGWIRDRIPDVAQALPSLRNVSVPAWRPTFTGALFRRLEPAARAVQQRMFPKEIAAMANKDSRVVVNDSMLKFHVEDRRAFFETRFQQRLRDSNAEL
jgi:predicted nucleotidyltransferase